MGYVEIRCILCATSFNIARIRTIDEPKEAARATYGPSGNSWVKAFKTIDEPCTTESTGCVWVLRNDFEIQYNLSWPHIRHDQFNIAFEDYHAGRRPALGEQIPITERLERLPARGCVIPARNLEHVAGPKCESTSGYLGTRISAEEMVACGTVQCLVAKSAAEDWKPEPDDGEIERTSDYFLTGISDSMPDLECGGPTVIPARHGLTHVDAGCTDMLDEEQGAPFHPWCFGLFQLLSRQRLGYVPVNELMEFLQCGDFSECTFEDELDDDLADCLDQWWMHNPGSEWLVTNPYYVPRLRSILEAAIDTGPDFNPQTSAFGTSGLETEGSAPDLFSRLPQELRNMILNDLSAEDIASLRQASRTFYDIPVYLWHSLIQEDMPWLFEIWSDEPPYFWATVTEEEIEKNKVTIWEEDQYTGEKIVTGHRINVADRVKEWTLPKPPATTTNWFMIYRDVKRELHEIRGLRNRKRLWTSLGKLLDDLIRIKIQPQGDR